MSSQTDRSETITKSGHLLNGALIGSATGATLNYLRANRVSNAVKEAESALSELGHDLTLGEFTGKFKQAYTIRGAIIGGVVGLVGGGAYDLYCSNKETMQLLHTLREEQAKTNNSWRDKETHKTAAESISAQR
tara:strand:+ start:4124 stop:4525 length:402 start_codon:yes stop_codon:yes gene_type:complete